MQMSMTVSETALADMGQYSAIQPLPSTRKDTNSIAQGLPACMDK